jgi:hypothetical protein
MMEIALIMYFIHCLGEGSTTLHYDQENLVLIHCQICMFLLISWKFIKLNAEIGMLQHYPYCIMFEETTCNYCQLGPILEIMGWNLIFFF